MYTWTQASETTLQNIHNKNSFEMHGRSNAESITTKGIEKSSWAYIMRSLTAGGIAGCAAKTVVAPLDRVKILFQTSNPAFEQYTRSYMGMFRAMQRIISNDGFLGLFQGHSATLLRIFPYASVKFMAYEQLKEYLMPTKQYDTHTRRFVAGSLAGCVAVFISYPLDLIRVRMAFEIRHHAPDTIPHIKHSSQFVRTVTTIYNEPNAFLPESTKIGRPVVGILNFYRGFLPTFYGMIPYAGVSFLTYDAMKQFFTSKLNNISTFPVIKRNENEKLSTSLRAWVVLISGGASGMLAQTIAYPFEVIRRRMQVSKRFNSNGTPMLTTLDAAKNIWHTKGFRGFWVGLYIGYIKAIPMFAVSFYTYEHMKSFLEIN